MQYMPNIIYTICDFSYFGAVWGWWPFFIYISRVCPAMCVCVCVCVWGGGGDHCYSDGETDVPRCDKYGLRVNMKSESSKNEKMKAKQKQHAAILCWRLQHEMYMDSEIDTKVIFSYIRIKLQMFHWTKMHLIMSSAEIFRRVNQED